MNAEQLAAIRALLDASKPRAWRWLTLTASDNARNLLKEYGSDDSEIIIVDSNGAEFIVQSPAKVAALLDYVTELERQLKDANDTINSICRNVIDHGG